MSISQVQDLINKADQLKAYDFKNKNRHTWCSGCGDYGILSALKRALVMENLQPHQVYLCYDVGCSGNGSDKIGAYTIHGLHGRVTSLASGASIANPKLKVIASAGDGATFSEGINHLVHNIRNNFNITFICHNNSNYGLTIGQASSTTKPGLKMSGTPDEVVSTPLNLIDFVLSCRPTFVARSFSSDIEHQTEVFRQAMQHQGFSFVEVIQLCPTFYKNYSQEYYWDKLIYLDQENHDKNNIWQARKQAEREDGKIALGVFYQDKKQPDFLNSLAYRSKTANPAEEVESYPIQDLLEEFF